MSIVEANTFQNGPDFVISDQEPTLDESYNLDSLREIVGSGEISGLDLEKFDVYAERNKRAIDAILATINKCETAKRRKSEANRQLNQLAFDISKPRI